MSKPNQYKAQNFIDAIPGSGGIITTIAKRVGCAWHTAAKYIEGYVTVKIAYDDELGKNLDIAEAIIIDNLRLLRQKQEKKRKVVDTADARWLLATKGKHRGYSQKQEVELTVKKEKEIVEEIERELAELAANRAATDVDVFENETQPEDAVETPDEGAG